MDKKFDLEYWQDIENKKLDEDALKQEFAENTYQVGMSEKSRRDFLKIMGFSLSVVPLLSSCKKITAQKAIPYLHKNDQIIPGVANWYATTCQSCTANCSLLVKSREGRPIKVEGNTLSTVSNGGICSVGQASVLSLYDSSRFKGPSYDGQSTNFAQIDGIIKKEFAAAKDKSKKIAVITRPNNSPSTQAVFNDFKTNFPNTDIIYFDLLGRSTLVDANLKSFNVQDSLDFNLANANVVVGFSADFLGTYGNPIKQTKQYSKRRDLYVSNDILKHYQVESLMSLTGSNADTRYAVSSSEESVFINNLLAYLQSKTGNSIVDIKVETFSKNKDVETVGNELLRNKQKSLVLYGGQSVDDQIKVNAINYILDNFGSTVNFSSRKTNDIENDQKFFDFVKEAGLGNYHAVLFVNTNPVYDFSDNDKLTNVIKSIPVRISTSSAPNETSALCNYIVPDRHFLEKWDDFEVESGKFSFSQPLMTSLFDGRQFQESLLSWMGKEPNYYSYMQNKWSSEFMSKFGFIGLFQSFWDNAIHDGFIQSSGANSTFSAKFNSIKLTTPSVSTKNKVKFYQKVALRKGDFTNNPWLQELPDPITKVTWDNYVQVSPVYASKNGIKTGDVVKITSVEDVSVSLPALVQPGVEEHTFGIALGYGRTVCGRVGKNVGQNPSQLIKNINSFSDEVELKSVTKTGTHYELALTQTHHSMEGRDIVKESTLSEYVKDPAAGNNDKVKLVSMWSEHNKDGHQWAMMIDLNKCTGCSGCIVSCNAENNVPVVGKDEVFRRREMHWLRLDRYYKGDDANPEVVHQPVMCMHCDNAPCETVCPVVATVHSSDGLNQQVYNRCVGTRYCANNCPYKVRRFNWFDYSHDDKYENMVLNPDIVVRSRGVMEKCSMCIQRIQEAKLEAKKAGRDVVDGEIKLACQQSCPADVIVFGDLNDPKSELSKKIKSPRYYRLIEELNIAPRVGFLTKIRNK